MFGGFQAEGLQADSDVDDTGCSAKEEDDSM
jgi:hypothetical protein